MVLAAAAVAGNGPAGVSAAVEQRLDLGGAWVGTWVDINGQCLQVTSGGRRLTGRGPGDVRCLDTAWITDEGGGRFRITLGSHVFAGIWKREGGRLLLCFCPPGQGRPTSFYGGGGQHLLTLRRTRFGK
jgi:hypothetical protein